MSWQGHLALNYRRSAEDRTVLHDLHSGPLRVLQSLYPESPGICHTVLVHPPGGIVGGDVLEIDAALAEGSHALITTPGATRYYRSTGATGTQSLRARVAPGARLEWLPLETIAYSGCIGENHLQFELAPGAEMIGWDVLALGLPAANLAFERGRFAQRVELPGRWLERGIVDASDARLLDSPVGWAGHRVLATMWFAVGGALPQARRDGLIEMARGLAGEHELARTAGTTSAHEGVIVMRMLAPRVEPAMGLLTKVWAAWRAQAWGVKACTPRVWRT